MINNEKNAIEKIRAAYATEEVSELDQLKALDKKVKRPAKVFAYVYGSVSSLILGTGMSLAMKIIGTSLSFAMPLGIGVGVVGIALMLSTYPLYKGIMKARKKKYSDRIFELSDSLLNK